jgi:hypothetical protein
MEGFPTSGLDRKDNFPGTIVYYYELTQTTSIEEEFGDEEYALFLWNLVKNNH